MAKEQQGLFCEFISKEKVILSYTSHYVSVFELPCSKLDISNFIEMSNSIKFE